MSLLFRIAGFVVGLIGIFYLLEGAGGIGLIFAIVGALLVLWATRADKNKEKAEEREWRRQMLEAQKQKNQDKVE